MQHAAFAAGGFHTGRHHPHRRRPDHSGRDFLFGAELFPRCWGFLLAPAWTDWMFAMLGAPALGFAYGMLIAQRDVVRYASWLVAMIIVQALEWGS